ncbi:unnamed protein product [Adineta steineri]|nr:unnamed protein product [Adineta steineri]
MRWCEGKSEGEIVIGGNGKGNEPNQLNQPKGLSFDDGGNLYVVDLGNNRIEVLSILYNPQPLSKRKQEAKVKFNQQGKLIEKVGSIQTAIEFFWKNSSCQEVEINWITISRKQSKYTNQHLFHLHFLMQNKNDNRQILNPRH